jgi:hypothetical protein
VGGGFMGLSIVLISHHWCIDTPLNTWIGAFWSASFFLFGIIAGLKLSELSHIGRILSALYQLLQVPILSSPILSFSLFSGFQIGFGFQEYSLVIFYEFGARAKFYCMSSDPWGIGVNILALTLFIYLLVGSVGSRPGHQIHALPVRQRRAIHHANRV